MAGGWSVLGQPRPGPLSRPWGLLPRGCLLRAARLPFVRGSALHAIREQDAAANAPDDLEQAIQARPRRVDDGLHPLASLRELGCRDPLRRVALVGVERGRGRGGELIGPGGAERVAASLPMATSIVREWASLLCTSAFVRGRRFLGLAPPATEPQVKRRLSPDHAAPRVRPEQGLQYEAPLGRDVTWVSSRPPCATMTVVQAQSQRGAQAIDVDPSSPATTLRQDRPVTVHQRLVRQRLRATHGPLKAGLGTCWPMHAHPCAP